MPTDRELAERFGDEILILLAHERERYPSTGPKMPRSKRWTNRLKVYSPRISVASLVALLGFVKLHQ